jgi:hypothetical protein
VRGASPTLVHGAFCLLRREHLGPLFSLVSRLQQKRDEILRFVTDLCVPFDNNGSERDLRMLKLVEKISGCFRSADGARSFCRIRSYLSTARKQGHSLLCSLERAVIGKPLAFEPAPDVQTTVPRQE